MLRKSLAELDRRRKNPDENQKGFTLIELLVVIIIIGILAAIAIPVFLNQRSSAWKASVASDLKNAAIVVETWGTTHNGSYALFGGSATAVTVTVDATASTSGSVVNATAPGVGLSATEGNKIIVVVGGSPVGTSFTITGTNTNISGSQVYSSAAGGLAPWS